MNGNIEWRCGIHKPQLKLEPQQACRGSSQTPPHASSITLNRKRCTPPSPAGRCCLLHYPAGRRNVLSRDHSPANQRLAVQPMRSFHTLDSQLPPMDSLVTSAPPNSPFFPYKNKFPFLVSALAYAPPYFTYPGLQFFWLFLNKLASAG